MSEPIPTTEELTALAAQLDEFDPIERAFQAMAVLHPEAPQSVYLWKPGDH